MVKKPNLLIYQNLVEPISEAIKELNQILSVYNTGTSYEGFIHKGTFAYVLALCEGSLSECVGRFLFAFPDKLPKIKFDFEDYKSEILKADFAYDLTAIAIQNYLMELSYKSSGDLIKTYCELLEIKNLAPLFDKNLKEKKARRNALIHNNLKVDYKYIKTSSGDPRNKGKYMQIKPAYVTQTIEDILEILVNVEQELQAKYSSYTILKLVQDVWGYLFTSAIMKFDDYWIVNKEMLSINEKGLKKYYKSLSTSEQSLLFYFIQNYAPGACEKILKTRDFGMQIKFNDRMIFLVSVFDRFPLMLQNLKNIEPAAFFKYVDE